MMWCIRHPKPDIPSGICYGQLDVPLRSGWEQLCQPLRTDPLVLDDATVIYSSPLQRCHRLAQWLAQPTQKPVLVDDRLKEMNFGAWEGLAWDSIEDPNLAHWMDHYQTVSTTKGEGWPDLLARVRSFLDDCDEIEGHRVLVTHAGVIRALQHIKQGVPTEQLFAQSIPFNTLIPLQEKDLP